MSITRCSGCERTVDTDFSETYEVCGVCMEAIDGDMTARVRVLAESHGRLKNLLSTLAGGIPAVGHSQLTSVATCPCMACRVTRALARANVKQGA